MKYLIVLVALVLAGCNAAAVSPTSPTVVPPVVVETPPSMPAPPIPVALSLSVTRKEIYAGEGLSLRAVTSQGELFFPTVYTWTFGDGTTATTDDQFADHVYEQRGEYSASVAVRDRNGAEATANIIVTVTRRPSPPKETPPPSLPAFSVSLTCTAKAAPSPTPCNVTVSYDGVTLRSSSVTHVDWDWGDGIATSTPGPSASHPYAQTGTYTVFAKVTATTKDGPKTAEPSITIDVL